MVEIFRVLVVECEVQYSYHVNSLQLIVPFPLSSLFPYREGRVIDAPVLEELLFSPLHLNEYLFAFFVFAVHVKDRFPVGLRGSQLFRIEICKVCYDLFPVEKAVHEADEQFLVHLRAEKHLESEVSIWIDVPVSCKPVCHDCQFKCPIFNL